MKSNKHYNIPVFLPHAACPFRCVFCDQNLITSTKSLPTTEEAKDIIEETLMTIPVNSFVEIAFFGGSFTALSLEKQESYLKIAFPYLQSKRVQSIRVSTRPDFISDENLSLLRDYGVKTIELGIQSFDDEVLHASGRGYDSSIAIEACKKIKESGFLLGIQLMPGLPQDTSKKSIDSANKAVTLHADMVRIYPTVVLRGTALARMYENGRYFPISLPEAISTAAIMKMIFDKAEIPVIRLGLYVGKDLQNTENVLGGAFHPSLGERVEQRIFQIQIEKLLENETIVPKEIVSLEVNRRDYSKLIGYRRENLDFFSKKYNCRIDVKGVDSLEYGWVSMIRGKKVNKKLTRKDFLHSLDIDTII